jgi:hypothetical protein
VGLDERVADPQPRGSGIKVTLLLERLTFPGRLPVKIVSYDLDVFDEINHNSNAE